MLLLKFYKEVTHKGSEKGFDDFMKWEESLIFCHVYRKATSDRFAAVLLDMEMLKYACWSMVE